MKNKNLKTELKREVDMMLPENMVASIKSHEVKPEKVNKNISVIHEKNRHSLIPIIASCVASIILCLAVFVPIAIEENRKYHTWLSQQNEQTQDETEKTDDIVIDFEK